MNPRTEDALPEFRCAVYTRKSTEEGLEQAFNSLDAQREAGEAYIRSQQSQGWRLLEPGYDDGGFTGANMERPALKLLLADIAAGRVDCVVVYKVDRLSRSLLDFARMMEIFERHAVTFVSVTQQFNTASSLGRLTLNVLLSFAQFEREIIAERTRDKQAAARRKGKWTGGCLVLGYDIDPRGGRLQVNQTEAARVREIFELFLKEPAIEPTLKEIVQRGWNTKSWVTHSGKSHQGGPFREDSLRRLLSNRLYIGLVRQAEQDYRGEHEAIVDAAVWERAQHLLSACSEKRHRIRTRAAAGLLCGLLSCGSCGAQMIITTSGRSGRRYRYYACARTGYKEDKQACPGRPMPADEFEEIVKQAVMSATGCQPGELRERIESVRHTEATGQVVIRLRDATELALTVERARVGHGRIVLQRVQECPAERTAGVQGRVARISRLVALALRLEQMQQAGVVQNIADVARLGHVSTARVRQILNLLDLAPDIQERLLFLPLTGSGRDVVNEREVRSIATEPDWGRQRKLLEEVLNQRQGTEPPSSVPGSASVPDAVNAAIVAAHRMNLQALQLCGPADKPTDAVGLPPRR